jgi:histidinol-phosphate/aromatic aminotransferase/cobyric acid decarboxylase-like protein
MLTLPAVANFVLCELAPGMTDVETLVARARQRGLFLRDVSNMGTQIGQRAVRIAVKDARTNERMLSILREVVW